MSYHYEPGAVRWKRFTGNQDIRLYRPAKGWEAHANVMGEHPITGKPLKFAQWWIREQYTGELR